MLETEGKAAPSDRIALLEKSVALNGKDSQTLMWLASAYGDAGRREDQVQAFERAYALDPLMPVLLSNFSGTLAAYGERERAERLVAELQTLDPIRRCTTTPVPTWHGPTGAPIIACVPMRRPPGCIPRTWRRNIAPVHLSELGNYAASLREAREIARINPGSSGISEIALVQALGGDLPGARAMLKTALVKEPGSFDLRLPYSYVLTLQRDPRAKDELLGPSPGSSSRRPRSMAGQAHFLRLRRSICCANPGMKRTQTHSRVRTANGWM